MKINEILALAIQAATPLSGTILVGIEWVRAHAPGLLKGDPANPRKGGFIRWVSIVAGIALAAAGSREGLPAPFDSLAGFGVLGTIAGVLMLGTFAGVMASGGKDILTSVASKVGAAIANIPGLNMLSLGSSTLAESELSTMPLGARPLPEIQPLMEGPVWDVLDMGTRAIKAFTGFPADMLLLIVKRVAGVITEPELAWAKIGQIVDRVRAGTALEVAFSEVLG
jgi:hypothetical protein